MSTPPIPYDRQANFTAFSTEQFPTVGQDLEAEFNRIDTAMDQTQARLAEIQRDDGQLANLSVHPDALSQAVRALLGADAGVPRGNWAPGVIYQPKDVVMYLGASYLCATEHTAGADFNADLAAGRWLPISVANDGGSLRVDLASPAIGKGATLVQYDADETVKQRLDALGNLRADLNSPSTGLGADLVRYTVGATVGAKLGETVSIIDFGGKDDDGLTDNAVPFSNARNALGGSGRVLLPRTATGRYFFSVAPNATGVTIDADEGVVLTGAFTIGPEVKTRRDLDVQINAQSFHYRLTNQYQKAWANKDLFLTDGDIDRGTAVPVATGSLDNVKQVWVSDTWVSAAGEFTAGSDSITWNNIPADTFARISSCKIEPNERLLVSFPTTGSYRRICVILTTLATYYVTADGSNVIPLFGNKPFGGASAYNTFSYNGRDTHVSYYPENCTWSVKVYDRNHFGVFFNGVEVTNIQETLGDIVRVGFGVQSLSGNLTASVVGWTKLKDEPIGGKQGITALCIGDSMTADIHGGWPYAMREALDMSFGIRVNNVINQAISGSNVSAQLALLLANGTQNASHAFVCLGTNDIQFLTSTATFLADLGTMIDTLKAAFCTPIVWIPPLWYLQAQAGGGGQATQNYEVGAEKRARIARLCADKGVKCVDMTMYTGAVLGTYLTSGNGLDPVLRDNIHPTSYAYRQIGFRLARALAGTYTLPSTKSKNVTTFPSGALMNGWTNGGGAAYAIDAEGFVFLSGYISPGTLTDGTAALLLPEHVRPAVTGRFIASKGGAAVALAQIGTNGELQVYGASGASYIALDGISFKAA